MEGQNNALVKCLKDLERSYEHGSEQDVRNVMQRIVKMDDVDLYALVLAIVKESKSSLYSKKKSISEVALEEFIVWLETNEEIPLEKHHKDEAMFYLVTSGLMFTNQLKHIYQLDKGDDRSYLAAHLRYLYHSKNDPKTAANVAVNLKLQDFIDPEELLLQLITGDKFQVAEELMKDSPKLQNCYAEMLNRMCSMHDDEVFDYIQNERRLRIVDKTKFKAKTLQKISEKFIKKYGLDSARFPHVFREKNLRSVRHVLGNRYRSHPSEHAKWDGNLEAAVANDTWLQGKLILMIAYDHHDIGNAAIWARKLNLPKDTLPQSVRKKLEENTATGLQASAPIPALINLDDDYDDFDDDCDGGFMFASDDVDCDETWEVTKSVNDLKMTDQYWSYPLSEENLKLVNTIQDLQSCIKVVFKPGNLVGFDSEWQPKYGRAGQKDKIAILQLAVGDQVFIIDVMEFDKTAEGQRLLKELFKMLFTSENTLRIGFGIDSDINVIVENYPYAQEFLNDAQNFEDLQNISKQIMKLSCVMKKLKIENMTQGKEKGLSFLVKQCFGKPLDKTYQVSNWEQRPLSAPQLRYAALDALCLVKIYDVFEDLAEEFQIIVNTNGSSCKSTDDSHIRSVEECVVKGPPRRPGQLKVVCDTMLQGLGRDLRCCGVDAIILQNGNEHMKAVEHYYQDGRVILTKGKPFYQMRGCVPAEMCMSIPDGSAELQLSAVFQRYNIRVTLKDIFSRCQICNCNKYELIKKEHMLLALWTKNGMRPKEDFMTKYQLQPLRGSSRNDTGIDYRHVTLSSGVPLKCEFVPLPVFDKVDVFYVCSACGKVYWEGSHFDKVAERFTNLIVDIDDEESVSFYEKFEADSNS